MAAAGYVTEADMESIWKIAIDTARFTKVNVRAGELLNLVVHGDMSTDVTDAKILPFMEQFSEELMMELIAGGKLYNKIAPWQFVELNVTSFFIKKYKESLVLIDMVRKIAGYTESIEVVNLSGFGARGEI